MSSDPCAGAAPCAKGRPWRKHGRPLLSKIIKRPPTADDPRPGSRACETRLRAQCADKGDGAGAHLQARKWRSQRLPHRPPRTGNEPVGPAPSWHGKPYGRTSLLDAETLAVSALIDAEEGAGRQRLERFGVQRLDAVYVGHGTGQAPPRRPPAPPAPAAAARCSRSCPGKPDRPPAFRARSACRPARPAGRPARRVRLRCGAAPGAAPRPTRRPAAAGPTKDWTGSNAVRSGSCRKAFHGITPSHVSHAGAIMDQFGRSLKST